MGSISNNLKHKTDSSLYNEDEIMCNLKNCYAGKKACIFSCGANLTEHKENFNKIFEDDNIITCCIKGSVEVVDYKCDILVLFGNINGVYLNNNKINDMFILKSKYFLCDTPLAQGYTPLTSFTLEKFLTIATIDYSIISFLIYIGIKEIYLFGFYLADYMINNLTNYNYYDDIICKNFHFYEQHTSSRIKETGIFYNHMWSSHISDYCDNNNCLLYNVSEYGSMSNKIKRITFDSIFTNDKTYINSKINYKDLLDEINEKVDIEYYYNKHCIIKNTDTDIIKKQKVINHLVEIGIYRLYKVNINDNKPEIILNNFIIKIINLYSYLNYYPINNIVNSFFSHYLIMFNKLLNICFYNDFSKISNCVFYDNLCRQYLEKINNINYTNIYTEYNDVKFNNNKYFKLFIYLMYYKNLPDDFDWNIYILINNDLRNMNEIEALKHYSLHGYKENRKYNYQNIPDLFNVTVYKEINLDLSNMSDLEAKNHYEQTGYKENRKYKY